ncbi:hypothetical protein ACFVIM_06375 [Streptomyces sp. NPDC057638]|uniref:hypothetical protein n=1 Tax=Streptomyces sp. NPDC057638 TaxID=3346190 RepID=UPI0036C320D6
MWKIVETCGGVLVFLGGCGVLRELTGWFSFMGFTRILTDSADVLRDNALFTNIVITVLGVALVAMSANAHRP